MQIKPSLTDDALAGATLLLQRHVPDITPRALVSALREYGTAAPTRPLTKREAAARLGVSIATVDRYLAAGLLEKIKLGNSTVRITAESIAQMLI